MNNDLISRGNRIHDLAVKYAAVAIHSRVHPIQHFHSNYCSTGQDIHFVSICRIQAGLQVKCQHGSQLRMNRLEARTLSASRSREHTHGTQKYYSVKTHGWDRPSSQINLQPKLV